MSEVKFALKPVEQKPIRYRQSSKYDPILDDFMKGKAKLVVVEAEGKKANYLRMQLNNRIKARGLEGVQVSAINDVVYLEKA